VLKNKGIYNFVIIKRKEKKKRESFVNIENIEYFK
jgi:hypothetical protein